MIKNTNIRITITISKSQFNWIVETSKKKNLTKSRFLSWLFSSRLNDLKTFDNLSNDELLKIAKAPWLD